MFRTTRNKINILVVTTSLIMITYLVWFFRGTPWAVRFGNLYFLPIAYAAWKIGLRPGAFIVALVGLFYLPVLYARPTDGWVINTIFVSVSSMIVVALITQADLKEKYDVERAKTRALLAKVQRFNRELESKVEMAVTTLKLRNEELTSLKDFNENILRSMTSGVLICDADCRVREINLAGEAILGRLMVDVFGKTLASDPVLEHFEPHVREALTSGRGMERIELTLPGPNGDIVAGATTSLLNGSDGRTSGVVVLFRDLTEVRRLQKEADHTKRLAVLGQAAASVAHEIRNPLNIILGFAQRIERKTADQPAICEAAHIIAGESRRINQVMTEILEYSKDRALDKKALALRGLFEQILEGLRENGQLEGVVIAPDYRADGAIQADPDRLRRLFTNLIENAVQAVTGSGRVEVGIETQAHGAIRAWIADNGPGIPTALRDQVFEPFFTTKAGGTGLGLAICRKIVLEHGGRISVESGTDKGCRIDVILPAA